MGWCWRSAFIKEQHLGVCTDRGALWLNKSVTSSWNFLTIFLSAVFFFSSRTVKQRHLLWRDTKHDKTNWVKFRELTKSRNDVCSGLSSLGLASKLNVILRCCFLFVFTLTNQGPVVDVEAEAPVKYIHERGVRECFILIGTFYSRHFWQNNIIYHNTQIDYYNYSQ